jgi:hypothetical protein
MGYEGPRLLIYDIGLLTIKKRISYNTGVTCQRVPTCIYMQYSIGRHVPSFIRHYCTPLP